MPSQPNVPYPAMSHPLADPAVHVVAARFAGLRVPDPATSQILEIGCATGHHLLPLAMRWPEARCTGIDPSEAIGQARALATEAGLDDRLSFLPVRLEDFEPEDGPYDFIIAHGFFSWVEESTRRYLFEFCREHLTPNGVASVSFNVSAGWESRMIIVRKARALREAGLVESDWESLHALRPACSDPADLAIIDDMLAKGADVLAYDDFAPINDPYPLDRFVSLAAEAGLRWLGESCVSENQPRNWTEADEEVRQLVQRQGSPLSLHQWMDERSGRTFRSTLLCRADAKATGKMNVADLADLFLRFLPEASGPPSQTGERIAELLKGSWPSSRSVGEIIGELSGLDRREIAREISQGVVHRLWSGSSQSIEIDENPPNYPRLDALRMACAKRRLPLVDASHQPCRFPDQQWEFLEWLDGTHSHGKLEEIIREKSPRFDFPSWLRHLHERGLLMQKGGGK